MLILHCNAVIRNENAKKMLLQKLIFCNTPFTDAGDRVSVDVECDTIHEAIRVIGIFEAVETDERGFSIIGGRKEVSYDTG